MILQTTTIQSIPNGQNQVQPYIFFKKTFHSDIYVTIEKQKMRAVSISSGLYAHPKVSREAGQIMCIVIRFSSHSLLNY